MVGTDGMPKFRKVLFLPNAWPNLGTNCSVLNFRSFDSVPPAIGKAVYFFQLRFPWCYPSVLIVSKICRSGFQKNSSIPTFFVTIPYRDSGESTSCCY